MNRQLALRCLLHVAEIETCYELGKGLKLSSQYDHVPIHVRRPPARRWRRDKDRDPSCPRWNHAALRWVMRDESLCEAFCDSAEQALSTSHIVNSDLLRDDWYGSVMEVIQQVASQHFGVTSTLPRFSHVAHHCSLGGLAAVVRPKCSTQPTHAGHSRRWVKPGAVPAEKALDPEASAAHMKKVLGATSSPAPPATPARRSSLTDHFAGLPALGKQALKRKNGKATTWSVPAHKFHLARADQLTLAPPVPPYML